MLGNSYGLRKMTVQFSESLAKLQGWFLALGLTLSWQIDCDIIYQMR